MSKVTDLCEKLQRLDDYAAELQQRLGEHRGTCQCSPCQAYRLVSDAAGRTARRLEAAIEESLEQGPEYEKP